MNIINKKLSKIPKIGMRSIKTVIATLLAIMVSNVLGFDTPFYATWTAFLCIQSSLIESSEMAVKRSIGTLIGGIFSLIYLVFMPEDIYILPFGMLAIIYFCNLIEKSELINIACVVFLVISFRVNTVQNFDSATYVVNRIFQTFIGIAIAILVNYYIKPPNPFGKLIELNDEMLEFLNKGVKEGTPFKRVKNLEEYRLKIDEFRGLVQFYHKEINSEKHDLDIKYYMRHLTLFRSAYSHIYILNSIKEGKNIDIRQYHIESLLDIKESLLK